MIAFEPQRPVFQNLCANVALNALSNVMTFHAGVAEKQGITTVPLPSYSDDGNFGGISLGGQRGGDTVQVMALDQIGRPSLSLIKIDVEGMELAVLNGASKTIEQHRPVLYVENDRREKSAELIAHIFSLGYRAYWHIAPLYNADNVFGHAENVFANTVSLNMLCLHGDVPQNIEGLPEVASEHDFPV